ncbi:MAG: signal recognition particle-docking protein FtsY, partial [Nitrospiraceae bacterium]|nr:signal recognition particle-docking protein FtsY [Nitrospiraceae bacterium]
ARARGTDIVLGDTAGRLQNKLNLIEELKKIYRTVEKAQGNLGEVLLVLDATVGQNGLAQAKVFSEAVGVTGVVLTKLDGSAKGGIAFAIEETFKIPVKMVGVGERIGDLIPFDPKAYVESLTALD